MRAAKRRGRRVKISIDGSIQMTGRHLARTTANGDPGDRMTGCTLWFKGVRVKDIVDLAAVDPGQPTIPLDGRIFFETHLDCQVLLWAGPESDAHSIEGESANGTPRPVK